MPRPQFFRWIWSQQTESEGCTHQTPLSRKLVTYSHYLLSAPSEFVRPATMAVQEHGRSNRRLKDSECFANDLDLFLKIHVMICPLQAGQLGARRGGADGCGRCCRRGGGA